MTSDVEIWNLALIKLQRKFDVTALGEAGLEGEAGDLLFGLMRDAVLRSHPWNFAIGRQELQKLTDSPAFEYDNQYQLPSDCLRVRKLYNSSEDFKIEGKRLLTNASPAQLIYIKQVTDTDQFDALFIDALATRLAAEVAKALTGDAELRVVMLREYKEKLQEAKLRDGQEGTPDLITTDTVINSREGYIDPLSTIR